MNISLSPEQQAALDREAREQSTLAAPLTAESLANRLLGNACDSYASRQLDADKAGMSENPRLMALAFAVVAQPDKLDAVEKAVEKALL